MVGEYSRVAAATVELPRDLASVRGSTVAAATKTTMRLLPRLFKANGIKFRHRNRRQPLECGGFDAAFPFFDRSKNGKAASKPPHSKASRASTLNLMPLALKSRAKLSRRCGDEEVLLHLFFKHHQPTAKFNAPLTRREDLSNYCESMNEIARSLMIIMGV